jgi:AraC-like DNA-binding protein
MKKDNSACFQKSPLLPWIELRIANQSSACYNAHSHDEFSFGVILQGTAAYKNRNKSHVVRAGDIVTINPSDVHCCNPVKGLWSYSMLFVDAAKMGQLQTDILNENACNLQMDYHPFNTNFERNADLKAQYLALFSALYNEHPSLNIETCLYNFIESSFAIATPTNRHQPIQPIIRIREKLLDEVSEQHELEDLAKEVGMSRYQLLRAFKNQYGLPPYAYLLDERIKRSKTMLKMGDSISEVAHSLGFSDQAHFQRQFKKRLAVTPKYYQSHFV